MEPPSMNKRSNKRKGSEIEEVAPEFFVYTKGTNPSDILKKTLTHLRVDSSVREIPTEAFKKCNTLVQVQLPETLTRIGRAAFDGCSELKCIQFVSEGSPKTSSNNPNLEEDGTIVFPEKAMLQIEEGAFLECSSLLKVMVCSASTELGPTVFCGCNGLISVELPQGLQVIEQGLFRACTSLETVKIASSVIKIGVLAFAECASLTSFDLPDGLRELGDRAFDECASIKALHIPATVSTIGACAFSYCTDLEHVKLPPSLERIEMETFRGCAFHYIEIPSTVSFIGEGAFAECGFLSHIRVPPSVDRMMFWALEDCVNLISIELPEGILVGFAEDEGEDGEVYRGECPSLVNLAITIPEDDEIVSGLLFDYSKLGRVVDNKAKLLCKLKHRFDSSPLNKLCYYQSYHSPEDAMLQLRSLMEEDPLTATTHVDEFGMTPLHILSLSQTPNMEMLLAVMEGGGLDLFIYGRDSFGCTPLDYLCLNRMPTSGEVIRRVLQKRFDQVLGLARPWKSGVLQAFEESLAKEWYTRRMEIVSIYLALVYHERREILSLLELCLWKMKIDEGSTKEQTADRELCRVHSGASIVIPHVLSFLDKLDIEDHYCALEKDRS
eukprot:scaffold5294_cov129-Cylindrotheca_fusiformis.AAC.6